MDTKKSVTEYTDELVHAWEYTDCPSVTIPKFNNTLIIEALEKTAKLLVPAATIRLSYESKYSIEATMVIR